MTNEDELDLFVAQLAERGVTDRFGWMRDAQGAHHKTRSYVEQLCELVQADAHGQGYDAGFIDGRSEGYAVGWDDATDAALGTE
jgi:hypothetical protein